MMCFWSISSFSFLSNLSRKCIEFWGPFSWIGVVSLLNCVRNTWFSDFPVHMHNCLKLFLTQCFTSVFDSSVSHMFSIWYYFAFSRTNLIPIHGNNFLPIIFAFGSSTLSNGADGIVVPSDPKAIKSLSLRQCNRR